MGFAVRSPDKSLPLTIEYPGRDVAHSSQYRGSGTCLPISSRYPSISADLLKCRIPLTRDSVVVHPTRVELVTPSFVGWCSIQLSYGCILYSYQLSPDEQHRDSENGCCSLKTLAGHFRTTGAFLRDMVHLSQVFIKIRKIGARCKKFSVKEF